MSEIEGIFQELLNKGYFQPDFDGTVGQAIDVAIDALKEINRRDAHRAVLQTKRALKKKHAAGLALAQVRAIRYWRTRISRMALRRKLDGKDYYCLPPYWWDMEVAE